MERRNPLFDSDVNGNIMAWLADKQIDEENDEHPEKGDEHVSENI